MPRLIFWIVLFSVVAFSVDSMAQPRFEHPDKEELQAPLGPSPRSASQALDTLPDRASMARRMAACGMEDLKELWRKATHTGLPFTPKGLIGKVDWLHNYPGKSCFNRIWLWEDNELIKAIPEVKTLDDSLATDSLRSFVLKHHQTIIDRHKATFEHYASVPADTVSHCDESTLISSFKRSTLNPGWVEITLTISPACLREQVRLGIEGRILEMENSPDTYGYVGTKGDMPCVRGDIGVLPDPELLLGKLTIERGDYDMELVDLLRLYYVDLAHSGAVRASVPVIDDATRKRMAERLFTVRMEPRAESYSFTECGNTERHQGTAQDTVDEASFLDDAADAIGDVLKWVLFFLFLWAVIVVALMAAAAAASLGGAAAVGAVALTVVAGSAAVVVAGAPVAAWVLSQLRIPETENHLLMINSSRYLINQALSAEAEQAHDERTRAKFEEWNASTKEWLLQRMHSIARQGFVEFNSPSYSSHALPAVLNVRDFARDSDLQTAAHIVLELEMAKVAAAGSEGRRAPPFRRKMNNVRDSRPTVKANVNAQELTTLHGIGGPDFAMLAMQYFTGVSDQLPAARPLNYVSGGAPVHLGRLGTAFDWVLWTTSKYKPSATVLEYAINPVASMQWMRHDGIEIYSRSNSFSISAGGILGPLTTPLLNPITPALRATLLQALPAETVDKLVAFTELGLCNDLAAAVPTTVMLAAGEKQFSLEQLLRFEGSAYWFGSGARCSNLPQEDALQPRLPADSGERGEARDSRTGDLQSKWEFSHGHNTCVYGGFACGTNLRVPSDMEACANRLGQIQAGSSSGSSWLFLSSTLPAVLSADECKAFRAHPDKGYHVAVYRAMCISLPETFKRCDNWGVLEVAEAADVTFERFKEKVLRNDSVLGSFLYVPEPGRRHNFPLGLDAMFDMGRLFDMGHFLPAVYKDSRDREIRFEIDAHRYDPTRWDISSVNGRALPGPRQGPYADGDLLKSDLDRPGRVMLEPYYKGMMTLPGWDLDLSDARSPRMIVR